MRAVVNERNKVEEFLSANKFESQEELSFALKQMVIPFVEVDGRYINFQTKKQYRNELNLALDLNKIRQDGYKMEKALQDILCEFNIDD